MTLQGRSSRRQVLTDPEYYYRLYKWIVTTLAGFDHYVAVWKIFRMTWPGG